MMFQKCLEAMSLLCDNDQKQVNDKEDKKKQIVRRDKAFGLDAGRQEDTKLTAKLSSISFILKDLNIRCNEVGNTEDSHVKNCPECQITKEEYKIDIKYVSLLEKIIHSVIQKEVTELLEGIHEDDNESPLQESKGTAINQEGKSQQKVFVSDPEKHSLRCLLIRLQRVLGELILQICFSLSRKTKSEKLIRLSKLNMTDITLLELRTLNYQFSALTDYITYMFKESVNTSGLQNCKNMKIPKEQIISLKQKINSSIEVINSALNSVKKIYLQQYKNKAFCKTADGKCCSRMYPHVHCNMNGNNFVMKYAKPQVNKQCTAQTRADEQSEPINRITDNGDFPLQKSELTTSTVQVLKNSPTSISTHILQDKLLTIIKDSTELQKKADEISKNRNAVSRNEESRTNRMVNQNGEKDKFSTVEVNASVHASKKELENAIDDIILDAYNTYSNKSLSHSDDGTKPTTFQKEYFINQAHLPYSLLFKGSNKSNKCQMRDLSNLKGILKEKSKSVHLLAPSVNKSRDYLPYSVSIESLPLSPEEIKELSFKMKHDVSATVEKYGYENSVTRDIFGMNIRHLADLINDDKCEYVSHNISNPNTPYSPSLTSLPLTSDELDELVIKLNKSKSDNIDQCNNKDMQVMYFETNVKPFIVSKKRKSSSYSENIKTKKCSTVVNNRVINVDKKPKDSDKTILKLDNLSGSISLATKINGTQKVRKTKSIELHKSNNSSFSNIEESKQIINTFQGNSLITQNNMNLGVIKSVNAKITNSKHDLVKMTVDSKYHKPISVTSTDRPSENNRFKGTSVENKWITRIHSRDMRAVPVVSDIKRLTSKSINMKKSKHEIKSDKKFLCRRKQKPMINKNNYSWNKKARHPDKRSDDKTRNKKCVIIHYLNNTCQFPILKVINLKPQNCFFMDKREVQIVLYKSFLKTAHKQNEYLKLNNFVHSKMIYPMSIKQNNFEINLGFPVEFYIGQITVVQHMKTIHTVRYEEYKKNLYFNIEKEDMLLADLKTKANHAVLSPIKKRRFKKPRKLISRKKSASMKNWSGDTRNLGQYSFSEIDITRLDSRLSHFMYITLDKCLNLLNNNIKYKKKQRRDMKFTSLSTKQSAKEFLNDISTFLKTKEPTTVHKKEVINQVFNTCTSNIDQRSTCELQEHVQKYNKPTFLIKTSFYDIHKEPLYLFDILGRPLTDDSGHILRTRKGEPLLKYNDAGNPISDIFGGPVFDLKGLRPSESNFNAKRTPYKLKNSPLVNIYHEPLKIYDCNGRPLTSVEGIPLVNSSGEIMLKFDHQGQPVCDTVNKPIYFSNKS